jgi:hypothetical protein
MPHIKKTLGLSCAPSMFRRLGISEYCTGRAPDEDSLSRILDRYIPRLGQLPFLPGPSFPLRLRVDLRVPDPFLFLPPPLFLGTALFHHLLA